MAEIVNLNRFRKRRERDMAERKATANRARHGQSKTERDKAQREAERAARALDNQRLDQT